MAVPPGGFTVVSEPKPAQPAARRFTVVSEPKLAAPAAGQNFTVVSEPKPAPPPEPEHTPERADVAAPPPPPDPNAPNLYQQFAAGDNQSLFGGAADFFDTMDMVRGKIFGLPQKGEVTPEDAASWLRGHEVLTQAPTTRYGTIAREAGAVAGSIPPGIVNWFAGAPFAALHGWHTAEEQAAAMGKTATLEQKIHYAVVEGVTRGFLGKISVLPIGRITKALIFGGGSGLESAAEGETPENSSIEGLTNAALGMIVPELTPGERARVQVAKDAAARGDVKGALAHLKPVMVAHADTIAKAARQFVEPPEASPAPEPPSGDPRLAAPPKPRAPKAAKPPTPGTALTVPRNAVSTELGGKEAAPEFNPEVKLTPLERAVVDQKADATLALRITQREYSDSLSRNRIAQYESVFHGVPDDMRTKIMASYQRGGVNFVPEPYRAAFDAGEALLSDAYKSAQYLGMEYEFRKNYLPGLYRDPNEAAGFFSKLFAQSPVGRGPSAGMGKPYFSHEKVFGDYEEARQNGLEAKTTNPATLIAWRVEAQNMALSRVLAMRDFVKDGLAKQIADFTEEGREWNPGSPFGPQPEEYAHGVTMDIGGKRYVVQPDAARMFKQAFHMDAANLGEILGLNPEGVPMRAAGGIAKSWMMLRNASIPLKLAFSGFHAMHIFFINMAHPTSVAFTQILNRRMSFGDFMKMMADQSNRGAFAQGKHLQELFHRPYDDLTEGDRVSLNMMLAGGFNPAAPGMYEIRAHETIRRALNDEVPTLIQQFKRGQINIFAAAGGITRERASAYFTILTRMGEALQGPLFRDWIPSLKAAAYHYQASAVLAARPELLQDPEAMRIALRDVAKSIDNRFGMMQIDKLFFSNTLKKGLQASILSTGWNLGFLREFVWGPGTSTGFVPDMLKMIRNATPGLRQPGVKSEVTNRMAYAGIYTMGAMLMSGLMTYMMTGQAPRSVADYVYPRMPDGSRLQTMNFTREFGAFYYHAKQDGVLGAAADWFESKTVPLGTSAFEVWNNRDYFGRQVYDENAAWNVQIEQMFKHVLLGGFVPISATGQVSGPPQTPSQLALSLAGFTRAPAYVEEPGIQGRIKNAYHNLHPDDVMAYGDLPKHDLLQQAKEYYLNYQRTKDPVQYQGFVSAIQQYAHLYPYAIGRGAGELKKEIRSWNYPPEALEFQSLDVETQRKILQESSPADQATYIRYAHPEIRETFKFTAPPAAENSPTPSPAIGGKTFTIVSQPKPAGQ